MKKITEEWIAKAEKDYLVAIRELKPLIRSGEQRRFVFMPSSVLKNT